MTPRSAATSRSAASLHVAADGAGVDLDAARRAAADFLPPLGIDVDREDLRETPARTGSPIPPCRWTR